MHPAQNYALYFHAISQDFRVPTEGVEYINLSISLISFGVILVSITCTITLYFIFNYLGKIFKKLTKFDKKYFSFIQLSLALTIIIGAFALSYLTYKDIAKKNIMK